MEKKRGRPFTGKGDPRNGTSITEQLQRSKPKDYVPPSDDGAPQALQDLRHAWQNGKAHDRTEGHASARGFKERDPRGFVAQMMAMESEHRERMDQEKAARENAGAVEEGEDVGSDRALALCEEWLREHGEKGESDHG